VASGDMAKRLGGEANRNAAMGRTIFMAGKYFPVASSSLRPSQDQGIVVAPGFHTD
jgi:hypothetical protein